MKRIVISLCVAAILLIWNSLPAHSEWREKKIQVTNFSDIDYFSEPVIIRLRQLNLPASADVHSFCLIEEQGIRELPFQVDDLNCDGRYDGDDELVFLAQVKAKSSVSYILRYSDSEKVYSFDKKYFPSVTSLDISTSQTYSLSGLTKDKKTITLGLLVSPVGKGSDDVGYFNRGHVTEEQFKELSPYYIGIVGMGIQGMNFVATSLYRQSWPLVFYSWAGCSYSTYTKPLIRQIKGDIRTVLTIRGQVLGTAYCWEKGMQFLQWIFLYQGNNRIFRSLTLIPLQPTKMRGEKAAYVPPGAASSISQIRIFPGTQWLAPVFDKALYTDFTGKMREIDINNNMDRQIYHDDCLGNHIAALYDKDKGFVFGLFADQWKTGEKLRIEQFDEKGFPGAGFSLAFDEYPQEEWTARSEHEYCSWIYLDQVTGIEEARKKVTEEGIIVNNPLRIRIFN